MQEDSVSQITDWQEEEPMEDHRIAWVRNKLYGDTEMVKKDLEKLSHKIGFNITRFEVKCPHEDSTEVVEAYTNTYSKIPKEKEKKVNNWMMKIHWSNHVVDVGARIENKTTEDKEESSESLSKTMPLLKKQQKDIDTLRKEIGLQYPFE